ncbi:hypothetical protein ABI59_14580 [Acidobacteria bacterium Mor1]|nr:hypothetical protein ABI59_14580 [Acidobacteria bacterium Mor1]
MIGASLRMGLALVMLLLAAWGWLQWQKRQRGGERRVEVIDRAALARGSSVALLKVDDRRLLVGVSNEGVRLLRDVTTPVPVPRPEAAEFERKLAAAAGTEGN